jgi:hypothetical protein
MVDNYHFNKFRVELFRILGFICFTPFGLAFIKLSVEFETTILDYLNLHGLSIMISLFAGSICISKSAEICEIIDKGEAL